MLYRMGASGCIFRRIPQRLPQLPRAARGCGFRKMRLFIMICHGAPTLATKLCMNSFGIEVFFESVEIYIIHTVCIQIAYSQSRPVMRLDGDFLAFEANQAAIRPLNISCSIELPRAEVDLPRLRSRPRAG